MWKQLINCHMESHLCYNKITTLNSITTFVSPNVIALNITSNTTTQSALTGTVGHTPSEHSEQSPTPHRVGVLEEFDKFSVDCQSSVVGHTHPIIAISVHAKNNLIQCLALHIAILLQLEKCKWKKERLKSINITLSESLRIFNALPHYC